MEKGLSSSEVTAVPAGVDGAVGVPVARHSLPRWFVAIVAPRHEKAVARRLADAGYDTYVAAQTELHQWHNGRRRKVDRVVIPAVVFVRCTERERREIVALSYITRFMVNRTADTPDGMAKPPAVIPAQEIARLRFMLGQSDYPVDFAPVTYSPGDPVRVVRGALRGLEGIIAPAAGKTAANRAGKTATNAADKTSADTDSAKTAAVTLTVIIPLLGAATLRLSPLDLEKI